MTESELTDLESTLAQHRATLRTVGNTATMQTASEELLDVAAGLVAEVRRLNALVTPCIVRICTPEETQAIIEKMVRDAFEAKPIDVVEVAK